jgi:hypothetical protein
MACVGGIVGALVSTASMALAAEKTDWSKHLVDGYQLTGNYDVRYLSAEPRVGVTVTGKSQADAHKLVDSYGAETSLLRWTAGEAAEILFDLRALRLLSAIDVVRQGKAVWQVETSMDGTAWQPLPAPRLLNSDEETLLAANLALPARYVRLQATAGAEGLTVRDVYIYGEKQADTGRLGGVYPAQYPPVVNEATQVRVVLRNASAQAMTNLEVVFAEESPGKAILGKAQIAQLDPFSAVLAAIPWTPQETEPHLIVVSVAAPGWPAQPTVSKVIPVTNRRIYLSGFSPWDNERLVHYNLFTTLGGVESYMAWLQGKTALSDIAGPCDPKNQTEEFWTSTWENRLRQASIDGIAMNEFATLNAGGTSEPGAEAALKYVYEKYPEKIIAPWLIGDMDKPGSEVYRNCDLLLCELYLNLIDHNAYRHFTDRRINSMREWGFIERAIICLSSFMGDESSTREELEREIRYIRYRAPEMPGIGVYGHSYVGDYTRFADELGYTYFIAPVVMIKEPPQIQGQTATLVLWNVGGMNAHSVNVEALSAGGNVQGSASVELLKAGQQAQVVVNLKDAADVVCRVAPGKGYTALPTPARLEVLPGRQVRGGPIQVFWDLESARIAEDRVEFLREPDLEVVHQVRNDGSWMLKGSTLVATTALPVGRYQVRLVDGKTGTSRTPPVTVDIVPALGQFVVTAINGNPWQGDPQAIRIQPGDTFEVAWDFGDREASGPAIYLSAPGEPLMCIDREEKPFTMTKISRLRQLLKDPQGEPLLAGRWTWPSSPRPEDLAENGGWLHYRKGPDDAGAESRVKISAKAGVWTLWIGTDCGEKKWLTTLPPKVFGAVPSTPVVTVTVAP